MSDSEKISASLLEPFPTEVIEQKQGKSYIGHEYIRQRIIEATGNRFDWAVTSEEFRADGAVIRKDKDSGENYFAIVHRCNGVLTIPGLGSRHGTGSQVIERNAGEDTFKAAESDAFKRAAMAFGVGLQLYMSPSATARQNTPQRTQTRPESAPPQAAIPDITTQTNEQFKTFVISRFAAKDIAALSQIVAQVGDDTERGCLMVHATSTAKELDWLIKERASLKLAVDADVVRAKFEKRNNFPK